MSKRRGSKGPSERSDLTKTREHFKKNPEKAIILRQNDHQKRLAKIMLEQEVSA
jgi:hypothetical protein